VVRTQGLGGTLGTTETLSIPTLSGVIANAQATKQGQDDRVRELEQRVRELEAQLRERDGQARAGQPFHLWAPQGNAEARDKAAEERAQARELRERMSAQARDYAKQAHEQAQEMRKQAEVFQKQALEQAEVWRTRTKDSQAKDLLKWKTMKAPRAAVAVPRQPDDYVEVQPAQPNPMAETAPEPPTAGAPVGVPEPPLAWWSTTPAPDVPRARGVRTPKAPRPAKTLDAEHAQDMQKMLTDMRRQMDEMREQMQALREELQRAPQRELR
jgi:hypothetical protein